MAPQDGGSHCKRSISRSGSIYRIWDSGKGIGFASVFLRRAMRIKSSDRPDKALNSLMDIHLICRLPRKGPCLTVESKNEIAGRAAPPNTLALSSRTTKQIV